MRLALKGDRVGAFVLDRRLCRAHGCELWKARRPAAPAGGSAAPNGPAVLVRVFAEPSTIRAARSAGLPRVPDHENLARALGGDLEANPPYLVEEFVEGASLGAILAVERYVPLSAAIPYTIQILRGLAALHREGLAHRDLRPSNVFVDEVGRLKLTDCAADAGQRATLASLIERGEVTAGIPEERAALFRAHLAPELRKRSALEGPIDAARADMFAFGVLLHEMLTGSRPAEGLEIKCPSQHDKRIPKAMDELVLGCLERTARARFPSAIGREGPLLEGLARAGFDVLPSGEVARWVRSTPWRAPGAALGEETGKFVSIFRKLASDRE